MKREGIDFVALNQAKTRSKGEKPADKNSSAKNHPPPWGEQRGLYHSTPKNVHLHMNYPSMGIGLRRV
jgi:hypothetical protein